MGITLSYNILPSTCLHSLRQLGGSTAATSAHLLGPTPGEAFTFLAFLLPLGAERGAGVGGGGSKLRGEWKGE